MPIFLPANPPHFSGFPSPLLPQQSPLACGFFCRLSLLSTLVGMGFPPGRLFCTFLDRESGFASQRACHSRLPRSGLPPPLDQYRAPQSDQLGQEKMSGDSYLPYQLTGRGPEEVLGQAQPFPPALSRCWHGAVSSGQERTLVLQVSWHIRWGPQPEKSQAGLRQHFLAGWSEGEGGGIGEGQGIWCG